MAECELSHRISSSFSCRDWRRFKRKQSTLVFRPHKEMSVEYVCVVPFDTQMCHQFQ